ncbi:EthD domain-containing protein [Mycobacterium sp. M1]|uniref:EthD domain-containing protein n=1 Tax=Mycolicibacter acidiphilus TaxID=2835306 RepID=A0ABS5RFQ1_9MYCO|nr:EthD domain-containing protein [Mycolicibacter acidiphilus]MBS9533111.1 EthD domain-containing protein [Mycolicibacter acidiphilus]
MEKVVAVLRSADADERWCERIRGPVTEELLDLGLPGLAVNVRDAAVRDTTLVLTTLEPPVAAVVSMWTRQHYSEQTRAAIDLLAAESEALSAYLVTESVPLAPPDPGSGQRTAGLANIALLRRPDDLDHATWLHRWQIDHTPVAIADQGTFGYTQNAVVRPLTADAPAVAGIVEELFPAAAMTDPLAWYGAADDADLRERRSRMLASVRRFGADIDLDTRRDPLPPWPITGPNGTVRSSI